MLLHYLGKLKVQIFCRCGRKRKSDCIFNGLWTLVFIHKFWYFRCLK